MHCNDAPLRLRVSVLHTVLDYACDRVYVCPRVFVCVGQCVCVCVVPDLLSTMTSDMAQVHTVLSQHDGCGRASADGKVLDTLGMTMKHYMHATSLGRCSASRVNA